MRTFIDSITSYFDSLYAEAMFNKAVMAIPTMELREIKKLQRVANRAGRRMARLTKELSSDK